MLKTVLLWIFLSGVILLGGCNPRIDGEPRLAPTYAEVTNTDLVLVELSQTALLNPGIPGCSLADLRPFGWKTVNSGLVDILTPEEYAIQTESLYQEGYLDYLQTRVENPERYQPIQEMSYEEFLETCNVFPEVDFSRYSVLGYHATGTGCQVTFEKHIYLDDQNNTILYELAVVEEGDCEKVHQNRNLIRIPRIPSGYSVVFSKSDRKE